MHIYIYNCYYLKYREKRNINSIIKQYKYRMTQSSKQLVIYNNLETDSTSNINTQITHETGVRLTYYIFSSYIYKGKQQYSNDSSWKIVTKS